MACLHCASGSHRLLSPALLREALTENPPAPSLLPLVIIHACHLCTQMTKPLDHSACPQALPRPQLTPLPLCHHIHQSRHAIHQLRRPKTFPSHTMLSEDKVHPLYMTLNIPHNPGNLDQTLICPPLLFHHLVTSLMMPKSILALKVQH
jgi:hypothetical protein